MQDGGIGPASEEDELDILMDIGALDVKERVAHKAVKAIVLTEDEIVRDLEVLLQSAGFDMTRTIVLSYYGVTAIKNLRPLVKVIRGSNPKAKIVVHRDRDYMTDGEAAKWSESAAKLGVEPFLTKGVDIESEFLNSEYLAALNSSFTKEEFDGLIKEVIGETEEESIKQYVNGRVDTLRKAGESGNINAGEIAVEAKKAIHNETARYIPGKTIRARLRGRFREVTGANLSDLQPSELLVNEDLKVLRKRPFGKAYFKATSPEAAWRRGSPRHCRRSSARK